MASPPAAAAAETETLPPAARALTLDVGALSDVGRVRARNEDRFLALQTVTGSDDARLLPLGLFAVADGMGGQANGDTASEVAIRVILAHALPALPSLSSVDGGNRPIQEILTEAIFAAHLEIRRHEMGQGSMGTTATVALLVGSAIYLAHVGDTRAYVMDAEGLRAITRDHSLVARLRELGQITATEARSHPQRNVLYRALGQSEELEVETYHQRLTNVSHLLLCSDGLWGMLSKDEIAHILNTAAGAQAACETLIAAANAAGGEDNITAVLLTLPTPDALPVPAPHEMD